MPNFLSKLRCGTHLHRSYLFNYQVPKYRETNNISWEKGKPTMMEGLNNCINTRCSKYGIEKFVPMEWKGKIIDKIDEKKTCSTKHIQNFIRVSLSKATY